MLSNLDKVGATLGLVSAFVVGLVFNGIFQDRRAPIEAFYRTELLNEGHVHPGGVARVRIYRDKVRDDCTVTSVRTLTNSTTYDLPTAISVSGGPKDAPFFDMDYFIPEEVEPSTYILKVLLLYACPGVDEPFAYNQPDTTITVREKPDEEQDVEEGSCYCPLRLPDVSSTPR
jgi:hypothetical protein